MFLFIAKSLFRNLASEKKNNPGEKLFKRFIHYIARHIAKKNNHIFRNERYIVSEAKYFRNFVPEKNIKKKNGT